MASTPRLASPLRTAKQIVCSEDACEIRITLTRLAASVRNNRSAMPGTPKNHIPTSDKIKLVERFTRINDDYLIYQMTVDDPVVMTHSWTARLPWKRDPNYKLLEYACHEGNYMMTDALEAARQLDTQGQGTKVDRFGGPGTPQQ